MSSVAMYGSCAAQLDLPSSDLDLVICGLNTSNNSADSSPLEGVVDTSSATKSGKNSNASRMYRLAEELEHHPWTIQSPRGQSFGRPKSHTMTHTRITFEGIEHDWLGSISGAGCLI